MPSDPGPGAADAPDPLVRLAGVLTEASGGVRPTPLELAELLWLAGTMDTGTSGAPPAPPRPEPAPGHAADPPPGSGPAPSAPRAGDDAPRSPLHLPPPASPSPGVRTEPHTALLAPAPPMLRHPLALQRSLRPLKRRVDSPVGLELDERATADRIARLGAAPDRWLPVMRPVRERWLRLFLVHDAGPTMPVWRPLIRELRTALAQSGVFRTVTVLRAGPDGTVRGQGAHALGNGRDAVLVVSDCMGPQWREGPAGALWYATLHRWARRAPLAVVQPLPEHLWRDTALPAVAGLLSAPYPAAPAAALVFSPYDAPCDTTRAPRRAVPLPVLEPEPRWLANWAALLAAPGGGEVPAAVAELDGPLPADLHDRTDVGGLSPEELVLRFRATASPEAFRLAGHLALGRPDLPVMRLVQAAVEPAPRPRHLAEVILSGMLATVPGPPGSYAFRPGVRDLLLRGLPRTARNRTAELLERVGGLIDERAGRAPGDFLASTPSRSGTLAVPAAGEAFATVRPRIARRLSGSVEPPPAAGAGRSGSGAPPRAHAVITFRAEDLSGHPEARITLEYTVHKMLSRGALRPQQYEVRVRPDGYVVRTDPDAYLLPVLVAVLRGLPEALAGLADPPRLRVTLQDASAAGADLPEPPRHADTGLVVVVPPSLYGEFTASSAAREPLRFQPLYPPGAPSVPPVAWFCPLGGPAGPADTDAPAHDLVRGPLITRDLNELGTPAPGRTAVVHTGPDGSLTLLNPVQPYGTRAPHPATYYVVDLTARRARHTVSLPGARGGSFTAAVDLSWHVADPVAFVRAEAVRVSERLLTHLLEVAARVTRRHPVRRVGGAQREIDSALGSWPVPGLAVSCSVRLTREAAPPAEPSGREEPAPLPLPDALAGALADCPTVLIGFDGPLARLFSASTAREAALDLLSVVSEHRAPQEALEGRPLGGGDVSRKAPVHPLEVLRAFAHDPLGAALRDRLDELELRAVPEAPATHRSVALVRALHASGRRVVIVSDVGEQALRRYLLPHRVPLAGIHGRADDLTLLMPHPDCLRRALGTSGTSAGGAAVVIGSSVAEFTAARRGGLRFIGYAYTAAIRRGLREAGCELTVDSLEPLLEAVRALPRPDGA
ncbi:SAV_2336 N-terminal domain-related protein [Streptomyces sp. NPDC057236]|uniref:SAV_2336 N-terminal domain-related protein n=1 Tax=Streptomyces sp. NPDC057236 TaxID=3346059 RepID=UPI00363D3B6F